MTDETLLEFPCRFPIKVMGKNNLEFDVLIIDIVRRHAPDLEAQSVKIRPSKDANFLGVTVTINATSKAQIDAIYRDLTGHPLVLMAL